MKKFYCIIICIALLPTLCLATGVPTPALISNNAGLFQWVLGLALLGNGIFIMRLLKSHDRLWKRGDEQGKELSELIGRCNAKHEEC
jgi:hypothetical protein